MAFNPQCLATGIGSFPHTDVKAAGDIVLNTIPEIPVWPQLSNINFREQMDIQFTEGLPSIILDESKRRIYFDTSRDYSLDFERFYENYLADNLDYFKISTEYAHGLYEMEKRLSETIPPSIKYFKTQLTGPITLGLTITDEKKRAIYYDEMFRDVIVKGTAMKSRWLLHKFKSLGLKQICFIDEPILSAFGSSTYVSVQRSDVVSFLKEVIDAIHEEDALAGIHCCGNTEWTILIDAGVDIISFDAYEFGETIGYYPKQIKEFLENEGAIAWGIVPTSEKINQETPESLITQLENKIRNLANKGIEEKLIWDKCLLTPSCGTGAMRVEMAEKVFNQLAEVKNLLRERFR